jgi:hypothetical protein
LHPARSATESDSATGEQAGFSGDFEVTAIFRAVVIVATAVWRVSVAVTVKGHAGSAGARNSMLAGLKLDEFRVELDKWVTR